MNRLSLGYTYVPSRNADGTQVYVEPGMRVELSPGTDLWARGARFGTVSRIELEHGREIVIVKMDHPQVKRLQRFFPAYLMNVE